MLISKSFWHNKTIAITGSTGFVGKKLVKTLRQNLKKNINIIELSRDKFDLTKYSDLEKIFKKYKKIDYFIHLAAQVGGIKANQNNPGKFFYDNAFMGINLMHLSYLNNVKKFITLATVCGYPSNTKTPFKESDLWNGYPEETNAPYGIAKKILSVQSDAYRRQYKFNSIVLYPVNLYGPGDNFDPINSHVIPALIKKTIDAKKRKIKSIKVWGDGSAHREFLYVEDLVQAIILSTQKYNSSNPLNIGTGNMVSIKKLVKTICELCDYKGKINWERSKPNGQIYRKLDIKNMKKYLKFKPNTNLKDGLVKTIDWYNKFEQSN